MSVRRRLIYWLEMVLDHLSEKPMQVLCRHDVHAETALDLAEGFIPFDHAACEGKINDAGVQPSLRYDVDEFRRMTGIDHIKPVRSNGNLASGSLDNLVNSGLGNGFVLNSHDQSSVGAAYGLSNHG
jgi:hypothetical protein